MTEIGQHSQTILQKTILIFTLGQIKKKSRNSYIAVHFKFCHQMGSSLIRCYCQVSYEKQCVSHPGWCDSVCRALARTQKISGLMLGQEHVPGLHIPSPVSEWGQSINVWRHIDVSLSIFHFLPLPLIHSL